MARLDKESKGTQMFDTLGWAKQPLGRALTRS